MFCHSSKKHCGLQKKVKSNFQLILFILYSQLLLKVNSRMGTESAGPAGLDNLPVRSPLKDILSPRHPVTLFLHASYSQSTSNAHANMGHEEMSLEH